MDTFRKPQAYKNTHSSQIQYCKVRYIVDMNPKKGGEALKVLQSDPDTLHLENYCPNSWIWVTNREDASRFLYNLKDRNLITTYSIRRI